MAMNRTLLELEPSCPAGTSGIAVTSRGQQMEPDTTTAVYKSRQAGRRWLGEASIGRDMRAWTVMLYNANRQFNRQLPLALTAYLQPFLLYISSSCPRVQVFHCELFHCSDKDIFSDVEGGIQCSKTFFSVYPWRGQIKWKWQFFNSVLKTLHKSDNSKKIICYSASITFKNI